MTSIATQYFTRLREYRVIVCKECKHAVWPKEVDPHLSGKHHKVKKEERESVQESIHSMWRGLITDPEQFVAPVEVEEPIPELSSYEGLMCRFCAYITTTEKSLKWHWKDKHNWTVTEGGKGGGRRSEEQRKRMEKRTEEGCKKVTCQRFFPTRYGSQYFRIKGREDDGPAADRWERIQQDAQRRLKAMEEEANNTIQEGEKDEVNRWLERTGWDRYLMGFNRDELVEVVRKPGGNKDQDERIEEEVWKAMTEVGTISQQTASKACYMIRAEAVRVETEPHMYKPLKQYWKPETIEKRVNPWRQILMFFVRTQAAHAWRSPPYRFTQSQLDAYTRLIAEAERVNEEREDGEEEEEEDQGMTPIRQACLDFCIELLNQEMEFSEWDCALNCAMAVLGVKGSGWQPEAVYTSWISSIMKCARYMVVQKATGMTVPAGDVEGLAGGRRMEFDEDSGYGSSNSSLRSSPPGRSSISVEGAIIQYKR